MKNLKQMSKVLLVDRVSACIIDFSEAENFLFLALVCRQWLRSWGERVRETRPITASRTIAQLCEASENDLPLYDLCSRSAALRRRDLLYYGKILGSPWGNSMPNAAALNDLDMVKFMRKIGCPMDSNTFEVMCFNGNIEAMKYLMQSGCPTGRCVVYAASSANLEALTWLKDNGCRLEADGFAAACLTGSTEAILWFENNNCGWDERVTSHAAGSGNLAALKLVVGLGYKWGTETTKAAAGLENMDAFVWLREEGCPWGQSTCIQASRDGRLSTIVWARARGCDWGPNVCSLAARYGHFHVLKWAKENGCEWNSTTLCAAAARGRLDILEWALANDCPSVNDVNVCASAASGSHLRVLKWLREEKGFAWDVNTLAFAADTGCYPIVEYCLSEGCPMDDSVVSYAVRANRFQMVKHLVRKGFVIDEDACMVLAAAAGNVQILEYLKSQGCVIGAGCMVAATKNRRQECVAWIKNQA